MVSLLLRNENFLQLHGDSTFTLFSLSLLKGSKTEEWSTRKTPTMWKVLTNHQNHRPNRPNQAQNHPTIVIKTLSSGLWHTRSISQRPIIISRSSRPSHMLIQSLRTLHVIIRQLMAVTPARMFINVSRQSFKIAIVTISSRQTIRSWAKATQTTTHQATTLVSHHHSYRHWTIWAASIRFHTSTSAHLETITFSMASSRWISTRTLMDRFRLRRLQEQQRQRPKKLKHRT